jgi:hypothetical protein
MLTYFEAIDIRESESSVRHVYGLHLSAHDIYLAF